MYALIHDTFTGDSKLPVVRHIFVGRTPEQAEEALETHMKTDSVARECTQRGNHGSRMLCNVKRAIVKVSPAQLQALQTQTLMAAPVAGLGAVGACPPPSFWRFGTVTVLGSVASIGTYWAIDKLLANKQERTRNTAAKVGSIAAFWLAAGIAWASLSSSRPDVRTDPA